VVTGPVVAAVLGLAGLALAQDDLIVDPWKRVVVAAVGERRPLPSVSDRVAPRPLGAASRPKASSSKPSVVPIGPPLTLAKDPPSVVPVALTHDEIFDPWASPAAPADASGTTAPRAGRRGWAFEITEIVDPWSKGPLAAVTDPLIVDPWAR